MNGKDLMEPGIEAGALRVQRKKTLLKIELFVLMEKENHFNFV